MSEHPHGGLPPWAHSPYDGHPWPLHSPSNFKDPWEVLFIRAASLAGLIIVLWEWLIMFDDEIECIWNKRNSSYVKWLYLFSRYFVLFAQVGNVIASNQLDSWIPLSFKFCKILALYNTVVIVSLLTSVEINLMMRVYALYGHSRRVAVLLITVLLVEAAMRICSAILAFRVIEFDNVCLPMHAPRVMLYFSFASICTQCIVSALTFIKHLLVLRSGWARSPVVDLIVRDGLLAFLVFFALFAMTILFTFMNNGSIYLGYYFFLSVLSSAGCRLIINIQRLVIPNTNETFPMALSTVVHCEEELPEGDTESGLQRCPSSSKSETTLS